LIKERKVLKDPFLIAILRCVPASAVSAVQRIIRQRSVNGYAFSDFCPRSSSAGNAALRPLRPVVNVIKLFSSFSHIYIGNVKRDVACDIAGIIAPYLLTLANRNDPISVMTLNMAKASK
jgi:hypothetical protein